MKKASAAIMLLDGTVSEIPKENYREMYIRWQEYSDCPKLSRKVTSNRIPQIMNGMLVKHLEFYDSMCFAYSITKEEAIKL